MFRNLVVISLLVFAASACGDTSKAGAEPRPGWPAADAGSDGVTYREDGTNDGAVVRVITKEQIESSCSCKLKDEAASPKDEILFGLSVLWIDAWEHEAAAPVGGASAVLVGEAETANGSRRFAAAMKADALVVLLAPEDRFDALGGTRLLAADWTGSASATPAPTQRAEAAAPQAQAAKTTATADRSGTYPAPVIEKRPGGSGTVISNWTAVNDTVTVARAGDKRSPTSTNLQLQGTAKTSGDEFLRLALRQAGLADAKHPPAERLEVVEKLVGGRSWVAFGTAKRSGQTVRFFAMVNQPKEGTHSGAYVFDAAPEDYAAWGGLAVPLSLAGVYKQEDFTPDALAQTAALSPVEEVAAFEDHYQSLMIALFQGTFAANMGTLNTMRSFNTSAATCAGMENCTVTPDGLGGYTAEIE